MSAIRAHLQRIEQRQIQAMNNYLGKKPDQANQSQKLSIVIDLVAEEEARPPLTVKLPAPPAPKSPLPTPSVSAIEKMPFTLNGKVPLGPVSQPLPVILPGQSNGSVSSALLLKTPTPGSPILIAQSKPAPAPAPAPAPLTLESAFAGLASELDSNYSTSSAKFKQRKLQVISEYVGAIEKDMAHIKEKKVIFSNLLTSELNEAEKKKCEKVLEWIGLRLEYDNLSLELAQHFFKTITNGELAGLNAMQYQILMELILVSRQLELKAFKELFPNSASLFYVAGPSPTL